MSVPNPIIIDAQVVAQTNVVNAEALGDGAVNAETLTDNRPMPHITIGEVQTLATGEDATATMTGDYVNPVLNLGLPRGEQGIQGEQGPQGEQGVPGQDGENGVGVPTGGTTGQVLKKKSNTDFDTEWTNDIFVAIYNESTYDELLAAHNADRPTIVLWGSRVIPLTNYVPGVQFTFASISTDGKRVEKCTLSKTGGWTQEGSNIVSVDSALSTTSTNPVQNKVVTSSLGDKIASPTNAKEGQTIKCNYNNNNSWSAAYLNIAVTANRDAQSHTGVFGNGTLDKNADDIHKAYVDGATISIQLLDRSSKAIYANVCYASYYDFFNYNTYSYPSYEALFVYQEFVGANPTPRLGRIHIYGTNDGSAYQQYTTYVYPSLYGIPEGGTANQVLKKSTNANYETFWASLTPSDIGAIPWAYNWQNSVLAGDSNGDWSAADLTDLLDTTNAYTIYVMPTGTNTFHFDENPGDILNAYTSGRKVLYLLPMSNDEVYELRATYMNTSTGTLVLSQVGGTNSNLLITFTPAQDGGMDGTGITIDTGEGKLPVETDAPTNSVLVSQYDNIAGTNKWLYQVAAPKAAAILYGEVDSTSTSTAFTATIPGVTSYYDGLTIMLKNGVVTSAANFTIDINGLGGKGSYSNMATGNGVTPTAATRDTTIFNINYTMLFTYSSTVVSGGGWIGYRGYNSDNNTIAYQVRTNSTSLPTVSRTRYYRLLFTNATNDKWVPANTEYDNSATSKKTVNQNAINPFGRIVYLGNSTNYAANANVTATAVWDQYAHALGYSFNRTGAALTLTSQKPVYVKCAPQADGSAIMDSTEPIVQALPSTDDGKIYIYLGIAYSATNIELVINHPVYCYKNGAIRLWTGPV